MFLSKEIGYIFEKSKILSLQACLPIFEGQSTNYNLL